MTHPMLTPEGKSLIDRVINAYHEKHGEQTAVYRGELLTEKGYEHLFQYRGLRNEFTTISYQTIALTLRWSRENHWNGVRA